MARRSEKELVQEVNDALSTAMTTAGDMLHLVPDGISVVGARRLANGGIIYTLNSDEAATWLREPVALENMAQAVGEGNSLSLQLNNVIVPFAPTTIDTENRDTWRNIETSSELAIGTIRSVQFLKPVEHHQQGQREAHLVVGFDSREQANKAIREGIIIEGKELQARKELPDASRCVKCSILPRDHDAKTCPNATKCGRCAGGHATRDCTVTDRKKFHCVNCKITGHGAVDRNSCPSFLRATDVLRSRHPESKYKYFVTEDPTTW
ncbi:hypothetical protein IW262DRAFT_1499115, partial [Armillaria fumosa]